MIENVFNYKVVGLIRTFPMIGHKLYKNKHEIIMIVKRFRTYVLWGNLSLTLAKVHCSLWKVLLPKELAPFPKENSSLPKEVFCHQGTFFTP
jgi:hypothetical protein